MTINERVQEGSAGEGEGEGEGDGECEGGKVGDVMCVMVM